MGAHRGVGQGELGEQVVGEAVTPYYKDSAVTIYHGDCREILPTLGTVDAVVTDPPYGIGADKGKHRESQDRSGFYRIAIRREYNDSWDTKPDAALLLSVLRVANRQILWGGNFFAHVLPESSCWLVWNKCNTMPSFGDCEIAWTNLNRNSIKMFTYSGNGLLAMETDRCHPTQKPLSLMAWCIGFLPDSRTILDPFMGSGTTLRAAKDLGRKAIGIEIEERYAEIAAKRMIQEVLPFEERKELKSGTVLLPGM